MNLEDFLMKNKMQIIDVCVYASAYIVRQQHSTIKV